MVRADELVKDVAGHLEVVPRNAQRGHDVLLRVALLHQPIDVLQIDVLVRNVGVAAAVVVDAVERDQISARLHLYIFVELEILCTRRLGGLERR